jgi:NitT/TauT family transport system substrate-binding protein
MEIHVPRAAPRHPTMEGAHRALGGARGAPGRGGHLALALAGLLLVACAGPAGVPVAPAAPAPGAPAAPPASSTPPPTQAAQLTPAIFAITSFNANYLPLLVGEEKGYYAEAGVAPDIQAMQIPIAMAGASTGEVPYVFATTSVVGAAMEGHPLRQVAVVNVGSFFLYADPSIRTIPELRGKAITEGNRTGIQDYLLRVMLKAHGLDAERDVNLVFVSNDLGFAAVQTGQVQAAIAQLPTPFIAEREGYRILGNTADYGKFPTASIGTSLDRIQNRAAEVKAVIRGTLLGIKYIKDHPDDAAEVLARRTQISPEDARRTVELMTPSYIDDGLLSDDDVRAVIDERRAALEITREVAPAEVVDFRLLRDVLKELGGAR